MGISADCVKSWESSRDIVSTEADFRGENRGSSADISSESVIRGGNKVLRENSLVTSSFYGKVEENFNENTSNEYEVHEFYGNNNENFTNYDRNTDFIEFHDLNTYVSPV